MWFKLVAYKGKYVDFVLPKWITPVSHFLANTDPLFLRKNTGLPVVHFTLSGSTVFTLVLSVLQVINIYLFSTHSLVFPPIIGGACMCLYISLLAIKSCCWLAYKGKYNMHFKIFRYFTREIILS